MRNTSVLCAYTRVQKRTRQTYVRDLRRDLRNRIQGGGACVTLLLSEKRFCTRAAHENNRRTDRNGRITRFIQQKRICVLRRCPRRVEKQEPRQLPPDFLNVFSSVLRTPLFGGRFPFDRVVTAHTYEYVVARGRHRRNSGMPKYFLG